MGVANKAWRCGGGVLVNNIAAGILQQQKQKQKLKLQQSPHNQQHYWTYPHLRRRQAVPWTVVCGLLLFAVGLISLFTGHVASDLEWYSNRFVKPTWYKRNKSYQVPVDIWKSKFSNYYYGCSERGPRFAPPVRERFSNGYLLIATSGGLNQQRTGITDAVVVAKILNATLVVPELDHHSFWKDESDFANIFDVDWFISFLAKDVPIVKRVPEKVMRTMDKPPYTMRVPRKSEPDYYLEQVLPILLRRRVVQLTKFDYRLSNDLDEELQKLRCRVNYHALRFTKPIRSLGQKVVTRMRKMTARFIAVHLRFEPDMLAFSGCYYGGGDKERHELSDIRKRWETLPELSPDEERTRGKCPLTPHEVGLLLRGLDFDNNTYLYVASGEIYGGEETLRPLKELFPNFYTKEMLASEELKSLLPFSSRLAAIDYAVCDESDVFVTNNNGNMAKILAGRRRYMGHKRTIRPNAKRLSALFTAHDKMDWSSFSRKVKLCQRGFMGEPEEMKPGRGEFHEFPSTCICQKPSKYLAAMKDGTTFLNVSAGDARDDNICSRRNNPIFLSKQSLLIDIFPTTTWFPVVLFNPLVLLPQGRNNTHASTYRTGTAPSPIAQKQESFVYGSWLKSLLDQNILKLKLKSKNNAELGFADGFRPKRFNSGAQIPIDYSEIPEVKISHDHDFMNYGSRSQPILRFQNPPSNPDRRTPVKYVTNNINSSNKFAATIDGGGAKRSRSAVDEIMASIKTLGEGFVRMENAKMEMAREMETDAFLKGLFELKNNTDPPADSPQ
ncbi:O-fucosyltransferase 29 [Salvia divinorum]|uniref:O-fucosyltransferase family protein n=1 Tax=Salvia divinorum TaxID=28513 RepID=A0ABD1H0S9_SALDI